MILNIFFWALLLGAFACTVQISITDFRHRIIPDIYLFPLMLIGLVLITFFGFPVGIQDAVIGATFGYLMAISIGYIFDYFIRKKNANSDTPIGMGDIKLIGVGGLWLGTSGLSIALIIACISGAIWARSKKQKYIPFAPFFIIGGILSLIGNLFLL